MVCDFPDQVILSHCLVTTLAQTFDAPRHTYATLLGALSFIMITQVSSTLVLGTKYLFAIFFFSATAGVAHTGIIVLLHGSTGLSHDCARANQRICLQMHSFDVCCVVGGGMRAGFAPLGAAYSSILV